MDFDDRKKVEHAEKAVDEEPATETVPVADNSSTSVEQPDDADSDKSEKVEEANTDSAVAEEASK